MSLNYELLGDQQAKHLRRQRLLDLEADHFRCVLDIEESPEGVDLRLAMKKISDVERRIKLHRRALDMPEDVVTADDDKSTPGIPDVE
jgi:hypothetical protein